MKTPGDRARTGAAVCFLLLAGCGAVLSAEPNGRSRLIRHVSVLSSQIGPRSPGSPEDRATQEYIRQELEGAGLQVTVEGVDQVRFPGPVDLILHSANVIGVLQGDVKGAILVGAHHDSRSARCPGAADDASGVAVVIEAARALASRPHHHTLVFVSFAGEESRGLPGSREFLRSHTGEPILLAITLDFVGSGKIFVAPFPEPPPLWANRLLARAAVRTGTYRVSFDPWLLAVPRIRPVGFWADHASFLEAGIPALNLSCQFPAWTYHTIEDRPERVEPGTLLAARDLVIGMVTEADSRGRVEADSDPTYLPLVLFRHPLFIPGPVLKILGVAVVLLLLSTLWRWGREIASPANWLECLRAGLMSLAMTVLFLSGPLGVEWILSAITGFQHPWIARPGWHLAGALLAAAFTGWLSLLLSRFIRPSIRAGVYLAPAVLTESLLALFCVAVGRWELAFPLLVGASAMILAAWSGSAWRRTAFGLLGIASIVPFLSPTTYRMFMELSGISLPGTFLPLAFTVIVFPWFLFLQHLACLPEFLHKKPGFFLRGRTGAVLCILALAVGAWNATRPSYDANHRALVDVRQEIDLRLHRAEVWLDSLETLRGVRLVGRPEESLSHAVSAHLHFSYPLREPSPVEIVAESDADGQVTCRIRGRLPVTPRFVSLRVSGPGSFQVERGGAWEATSDYKRVDYSSGKEIEQVIRLRPGKPGPISFEVVIASDDDFLGLRPTGGNRVFRMEAFLRLNRRIV